MPVQSIAALASTARTAAPIIHWVREVAAPVAIGAIAVVLEGLIVCVVVIKDTRLLKLEELLLAVALLLGSALLPELWLALLVEMPGATFGVVIDVVLVLVLVMVLDVLVGRVEVEEVLGAALVVLAGAAATAAARVGKGPFAVRPVVSGTCKKE
jgi:hypothetical protein